MAKEKKVFGTETKNTPVEAPQKANEKIDGVYTVTETSTEDLLNRLKADSKKRSDNRKKKKIEDYKVHRATKESLFNRLKDTIEIPIIMGPDDVEVFTIKRLSEAENSEIINRALAIKDPSEMTEEELEESNAYNYRLLEKIVVDPYLTQEEWRLQVPTAIVQELLQKSMRVLTNIDDSSIFDEFQK